MGGEAAGRDFQKEYMFKSKAHRWSQMARAWWAMQLYKVGRARP